MGIGVYWMEFEEDACIERVTKRERKAIFRKDSS